jgi:hypothetical protein
MEDLKKCRQPLWSENFKEENHVGWCRDNIKKGLKELMLESVEAGRGAIAGNCE